MPETRRFPPDCTCDGKAPWCPTCVLGVVVLMWSEHPESLSVGMLKRRIPRLSGREAALLLEATRWLPSRYHKRASD